MAEHASLFAEMAAAVAELRHANGGRVHREDLLNLLIEWRTITRARGLDLGDDKLFDVWLETDLSRLMDERETLRPS